MPFSMLGLLLLTSSLLPFSTNAGDMKSRSSSADQSQRQAWQCAAVLGDYMYIEGGETENGAFNKTRTLPLNTAWTSENVEIGEIDHATHMNRSDHCALWHDASRNSLYRWGGEIPGVLDVEKGKKDQLHILQPNGQGGGSWTTKTPSEANGYKNMKSSTHNAWTACQGIGFTIGGHAFNGTGDYALQQDQPTPGALTYNMSSAEWSNYTSEDINGPNLSISFSRAVCLQGFSSSPLVMVLGGHDSESPNNYRDMTYPLIFDMSSAKWYDSQETKFETSPPAARRNSCVVGAQSKSGTFEIFIYGGANHKDNTVYNDIWVLSLPAFQWFRVCVVAGNRQMISYGGLLQDNKDGLAGTDDFTHGIGIFDMVKLEWTTSFDPNMDEYDSPDQIKEWYSNNNVTKANFASSELGDIFLSAVNNTNNIETQSISESNTKKVQPGVIAGATVGAIALLALLGVGLWFRFRRRPRHHTQLDDNNDEKVSDKMVFTGHDSTELNPLPGRGELDSTPLSEIECHQSEIKDSRVAELDQPVIIIELDATQVASLKKGV